MIYGYARVSTAQKQNEARQIEALIAYGVEEKYIKIDKASGKDFNRENYQLLKNEILRPGDTLVVKELDRLGRNKEQIKEELNYFKSNKIRVKILNIPTTLMDLPEGQEWVFDMVNNILIEVLGAIAEDERIKIKQRQSEGIAAMQDSKEYTKAYKNKNGELVEAHLKKKSSRTGKVTGRPSMKYPKQWAKIYNQYITKELNVKQICKLYDIPRSSFYVLVDRYRKENNLI